VKGQLTRLNKVTKNLPPIPKKMTMDDFDWFTQLLSRVVNRFTDDPEQIKRLTYDYIRLVPVFVGFEFDVAELGIPIWPDGERTDKDRYRLAFESRFEYGGIALITHDPKKD